MLDNGEVVVAAAGLSAIGLKPLKQLAQAAGLRVNRGMAVNRFLETCASDIYAIGDCAEVDGLILPLVQPLVLQARSPAASLTGEKQPVVYPLMPVG